MFPVEEWRFLIQFFADDISAAVARNARQETIVLADGLAEELLQVLREPRLYGRAKVVHRRRFQRG